MASLVINYYFAAYMNLLWATPCPLKDVIFSSVMNVMTNFKFAASNILQQSLCIPSNFVINHTPQTSGHRCSTQWVPTKQKSPFTCQRLIEYVPHPRTTIAPSLIRHLDVTSPLLIANSLDIWNN